MEKLKYPTHLKIHYENNEGYHLSLVIFFEILHKHIATTNVVVVEDDVEEYAYFNEQKTNMVMNYLHETTKNHPTMKKLYEHHMQKHSFVFSSFTSESNDPDPTYELMFLFAYENFETFHLLLCDFFETPLLLNEDNPHFVLLMK